MNWNLGLKLRAKQTNARINYTNRLRLRMEPLEERALLATLPAGFNETTVIIGLSGPTAMEFSPDGRLWAIEQRGNVKLVRGDGTTFTALTKTVDSNGERGLLGIAFDPNFATNKYVYLYYTNPAAGTASWATGVHNQLSRFTVNDANPQQPTLTAEAPILDMNTLSGATNHNAGAIHFGADGKLYVNTGDNVQSFTGPNGNNYRVSQTLNNLLGKQLRIDVAKFNSGAAARNSTAVGGLIPSDNPFVGTATGINQLIYVLGLRNPFSFAVQPGTGKMIVNDVGETQWEELNLVTAGANYGWAGGSSDGFGHPQPSFAPGTYKDPLLAYAHNGTASKATGAAVVGSTFYNPQTVQFPASYVGMYFYQDLASGWIRYFNPNAPNTAGAPDGNSQAFATGTPGGLRDLKVDSAGSLYYLAGGDGSIRRISYGTPTGSAPAITTQPGNQQGGIGSKVTFTVAASGSTPMTYQWQHQLNGAWANVGTNSTTYTINSVVAADAGNYRVIAANSRGSATSNVATLTINQLPTVTITAPTTTQKFNWGQTISFAGSATDPEDGALASSKLNWEILFYHQTAPDGTGLHYHPFKSFSGVANGSIVANFDETSPYIWYRIVLSATDSKGGTSSKYVDVKPNVQTFTLQTNPAGLQLMLDGAAVASGTNITGTIGQPRTIGVVNPQTVGGVNYAFASWSDNGAMSHAISIPAARTTYTANFSGSAPPPPPPPPPPTSTIHLEAENFALTKYKIENNTSASGGKLISLKDVGPGVQTGSATTTFNGATGSYRVIASVYDESDGNSAMSIKFGSAAPIAFQLNANPPSADANAASHVVRDLGIVQLTSGQPIVLAGTTNGGEFARWDYIDLQPSGTTTPTNPPGLVAINAGGPATAGGYVADTGYNVAGTGSTTHAIDTGGVTNPAPMSVYQSWHNNSPTYTIPNLTPGSTYVVRLHFAESIATAAGQRVQYVLINGTRVLTNYDIYAEVGAFKAQVKQFNAAADANGRITIAFKSVVGPARVSGIEILKA